MTSECGELRRFLLLLSITCWTLTGCGSGNATKSVDAKWIELGHYNQSAGKVSDVQKESALIVTNDQYDATFAGWRNGPTPGENDAPKLPAGKRALFVSSGANLNDFTVNSVKRDGDVIQVRMVVPRAGKHCDSAAVVLYPFKVLAIDDTSATSAKVIAKVHTENC